MFSDPSQFEPLLPSEAKMAPLLAKAHELARLASPLAAMTVPPELRALLRNMNSYYTNRIEGQHTRPHEIDQALKKDFSQNPDLAAKQRLAIAHIDCETALEQRFSGDAGTQALYHSSIAQEIHADLFSRTNTQDLMLPNGDSILPGQLRTQEVTVGKHIAPYFANVPSFLGRWATFYGGVRPGEGALIAAAAAHQRLGWIHPFVDGNGRVMRLHTHLLLGAMGYTGGLWSPLRGFARKTESYYAHLANADLARQGDLDGRGNLSEAFLILWIDYVLDTCIDQASFMKQALSFESVLPRLEACLTYESKVEKQGVRQESLRALHYLFVTGSELSRGEFKMMMGLGERSATTALGALIDRGFLKSDSPQGRVRFGLPHHSLRFLFPNLWPEAEADSANLALSAPPIRL
jgi:Fic family protein